MLLDTCNRCRTFAVPSGVGTTIGWALIANCEFFYVSQLIDSQTNMHARILQYGTGSSIAIIGFKIWPDLTRTPVFNYAIKTRPTVYFISNVVQ